MFEQVLAESGQFKCAKKKKPCLLMLTLDVKKAAVIIFEKRKYFSHNRKQDFTNFTTEGFKGYLMPDKFRKNKKFCLNNRMHFTYLCSLYFYINLFYFI